MQRRYVCAHVKIRVCVCVVCGGGCPAAMIRLDSECVRGVGCSGGTYLCMSYMRVCMCVCACMYLCMVFFICVSVCVCVCVVLI